MLVESSQNGICYHSCKRLKTLSTFGERNTYLFRGEMRTTAAIVHVVLGERKWVGALKYKPGDPVKRSITFYGWPDSKSAATLRRDAAKPQLFGAV
jgi:hypothetical protein